MKGWIEISFYCDQDDYNWNYEAWRLTTYKQFTEPCGGDLEVLFSYNGFITEC